MPPIIAGVLFDVLSGPSGASVALADAVDKKVDEGEVKSMTSKTCCALAGSNLSPVTTSRNAHAGTAVSGLILFGYLSSAVNFYL